MAVKDSGGREQAFEVVARRTYEKDRLPVEEIFARSGAPRLALVTCTGSFDRAAGSYRDNVVVYAVPVDAPPSSAQ